MLFKCLESGHRIHEAHNRAIEMASKEYLAVVEKYAHANLSSEEREKRIDDSLIVSLRLLHRINRIDRLKSTQPILNRLKLCVR